MKLWICQHWCFIIVSKHGFSNLYLLLLKSSHHIISFISPHLYVLRPRFQALCALYVQLLKVKRFWKVAEVEMGDKMESAQYSIQFCTILRRYWLMLRIARCAYRASPISSTYTLNTTDVKRIHHSYNTLYRYNHTNKHYQKKWFITMQFPACIHIVFLMFKSWTVTWESSVWVYFALGLCATEQAADTLDLVNV